MERVSETGLKRIFNAITGCFREREEEKSQTEAEKDKKTAVQQTQTGEENIIATDDWVVDFITCYGRCRALWDIGSSEYRSSELKEKGYKELWQILRQFKEDATLRDVRSKIYSLRSHYRIYRLRVLKSQYRYKPTLYWFTLMSFLDPVLKFGTKGGPRPDDSSTDNRNEEDTDDSSEEDTDGSDDDSRDHADGIEESADEPERKRSRI
ncbi:uncharacterized protein LOC111075612 isoform X2 [Drosophila obscura]|uniref:uncharacterized protein LOC111075612 isoform X2 n=1 Tax=Drosophila obscura TaxID=7282 RepID=UPI000BA14AD5|nr:uncharacterized protein LOC111075612 isoform X2 [Drosophila obscura]